MVKELISNVITNLAVGTLLKTSKITAGRFKDEFF